MATNFEMVKEFHRKFGLPVGEFPQTIESQDAQFRIARLDEELAEFIEAEMHKDLPAMADALIDLVYVAMGTGVMMGIPWDQLFAEVHRVNMKKVRVTDPGQSRFGHIYDVVKPLGWEGPKVKELLDQVISRFREENR